MVQDHGFARVGTMQVQATMPSEGMAPQRSEDVLSRYSPILDAGDDAGQCLAPGCSQDDGKLSLAEAPEPRRGDLGAGS